MAEVTQLSNGIQVSLEHLPYLRTVSFGVWIHVGSASEGKSNNGISHMLEHMFFKGTKNRTAKQIADITSSIGDDVNAFTGKEVTCYYGSTVTESLPILIDLLAEMLQDSCFDEKDIRKEKRVICDEIDMYEDSPEDLVHEILEQKVFKNQPLGFIISGNKTVVRSFTKSQLLAFMKLHYTADNIIISVSGNFQKELLLMTLEEKFRSIPKGSQKAGTISSLLKKKQIISVDPYQPKYINKDAKAEAIYHSCFCTRHKEIEQLHMNLAFPAISNNSPQNDVFQVFNSILGGSNNSRLFQKIREELGLAYSIYSYGNSFNSTGLFHIDITVNPSQAILVLDATFEVLKDIILNGMKEEELITHKSQVITEFIMSSESAKARMNSNAKSLFVRGYIRSHDEGIDKLKLVTLEEVNEFAKQLLIMSKLSMCLVGSRNDNKFTLLKKKWLQMKEEG